MFDGGLEEFGVGGEALQDDEVGGEAEDGDAGAGAALLDVLLELVADVGLVLQWGVEGVEEKDVEGAVGGPGCSR